MVRLLPVLLWLAAVPLFAQASLSRGDVLVQAYLHENPFTGPSVYNLYRVSSDGSAYSILSRVTDTFYQDGWTHSGLLVPRPQQLLFVHSDWIIVSTDGLTASSRVPIRSSGEIVPLRSERFLAPAFAGQSPYSGRLVTFDAAGGLLATQDISREVRAAPVHLELLSDQCTLLYSARGFQTIFRYDRCRDVSLPDFAANLRYAGAIRQLPDGDVLIAAGNDVRRYSAGGTLIRIYEVPATHIALTPDAKGFWAIAHPYWSGPMPVLHRVDFATPDVPAVSLLIAYETSQAEYASSGIYALAVAGEWRASAAKPKTRAARH